MKRNYLGLLFISAMILASCGSTREITSKNKIKVEGLRSFLDAFEATVASNDRQDLMGFMFPVYRTTYGDSDKMMEEFFNVIDDNGNIELLDYLEIDHIEFVSIMEYEGGYGSKYAPRYKIYMKNGDVFSKGSWRIHLEEGVFSLSSAMG